MGGPPTSQVAPLPNNLPFKIVSKTIGCGAYASIKKATPLNANGPVIAVKFINKEHAFRTGHLRPKQLTIELSLHKLVCPHSNIINYLHHGEDANWVWLCLELADGGDLFDKIEADEGVAEDIAHFYFVQLCSAIAWCHGKGVAHRDIKPENMLLSAEGDLKLADFGLATRYLDIKSGKRKACGMVCGSPPYIAPEILTVGHTNGRMKSGEEKIGYDPQITDIWSCAIVLFVLLVGNTPWDSPDQESYEYYQYIRTKGRPDDELWTQVPNDALSLLRGMLRVESTERFAMHDIQKHPWFTRRNPHLNSKGKAADQLALATKMIENMHINFDAEIRPSQSQRRRDKPKAHDPDAMDIDSEPPSRPDWYTFALTQPETPTSEMPFDWEAPPRPGAGIASGMTASQPLTNHARPAANYQQDLLSQLYEDVSMSQFSATPSVPLTLTQQARHFNDIMPSHSLARFLSIRPIDQLLPMILSALHRLNIPVAPPPQSAFEGREASVRIKIKTVDARQQPLSGDVLIERIQTDPHSGATILEVRFIKAKGDPLGWRRLFKQVAVLSKDAIVKPS